MLELRPRVESVFACNDELGIGEAELFGSGGGAGQHEANAIGDFGCACSSVGEKLLGLLLQLLDAGARGELFLDVHDEPSFG